MSPVKPETKAQVCEGKQREKDYNLATCKLEGEEKQDCTGLLVFTFPQYNTEKQKGTIDRGRNAKSEGGLQLGQTYLWSRLSTV